MTMVFLDELRRAAGDESFWRFVQAYTKSHRSRSVVSEDFEKSFERAVGKDLKPLFQKWIDDGSRSSG